MAAVAAGVRSSGPYVQLRTSISLPFGNVESAPAPVGGASTATVTKPDTAGVASILMPLDDSNLRTDHLPMT